ncbi:MAG: hypothetical protein JSV26_02545 [bacterium]|nr:MAG: hypothetical protein JSV26_02545 [bacterium]
MSRLLAQLISVLLLAAPVAAGADVMTITVGPGTSLIRDRDTGEDRDFVILSLLPSYRSRTWNVSLDLNLRWDSSDGSFFKEEWSRRGDWLRPLRQLTYSSRRADLTLGLERLTDYTLGSGQLVRGLIGDAEVQYGLPGFFLEDVVGDIRVQAAADRTVDPSVAGVAFIWGPSEALTVSLEGAVDPEAPLAFSGQFEGGRPVADSEEEVTGWGGEVSYRFLDGRVFNLTGVFRGGSLEGGARGQGGGIRLDLDFSSFYVNRLTLRADSVSCERGYVPAYFDELYSLERWGLTGEPLRVQIPFGEGVPDRTMWMTSLRYALGDFFLVVLDYDRFEDGSMERARVSIKILEEGNKGIEAFAWSRTNSEDENLFDSERNFFARVTALYNLRPHLLFKVGFDHSWAITEERGGVFPRTDFMVNLLYTISM